MATRADRSDPPGAMPSRDADGYEKLLSAASGVLLAAILTAIVRGRADWADVSLTIWLHLILILLAVALTPVILLRRRGDRAHRVIGWIWAGAMFLTALVSFLIHSSTDGAFSIIHILSVWTMIQVPRIIWHARHHNVRGHRRAVRGMVTGALLIAGFFTFPFDRLLGHWLFT